MKRWLRNSWILFLILPVLSVGAQSDVSIPPVEMFRITIDGEDFEQRLQGNNLDFSNRMRVKFFLGTREVSEVEYLKSAGENQMAAEAEAYERNLSYLFWTGVGVGLVGIALSVTGGKSENGNPSPISGFGFLLLLSSPVPMVWAQTNKTRYEVFQLWKIGQNANGLLINVPQPAVQPVGTI